jgi:hypothetical protein
MDSIASCLKVSCRFIQLAKYQLEKNDSVINPPFCVQSPEERRTKSVLFKPPDSVISITKHAYESPCTLSAVLIVSTMGPARVNTAESRLKTAKPGPTTRSMTCDKRQTDNTPRSSDPPSMFLSPEDARWSCAIIAPDPA